MKKNGALAYQAIDTANSIETASPYQLIQLYFEKAIERLLQAKAHIHNSAIEERTLAIGQVIEIVNHLKACLDFETGKEIAINLEKLYSFIVMRLCQANAKNNADFIDESLMILKEIKAGWDSIVEVPHE
jgi:flagellar protein FliS